MTTLVLTNGSYAERLATVVADLYVFTPEQIPEELRPKYVELGELLRSGKVPEYAEKHPNWRKAVPACHLTPAKAQKALKLIAEMFEGIAWELTLAPTAS